MVKKATKTTTAKRTTRLANSKNAPAPKSQPELQAAASRPSEIPPSNQLKTRPKLLPAWKILGQSLAVLWRNRLLFFGITVTYALLSLLFVQSLSGALDLANLSTLINEGTSRLSRGLLTAQWLISSSGPSQSESAGIYQLMLIVIVSLAIIWALRQVATGQKPRIRDAYYRGMSPLIPVILIGLVVIVQLLPALIGLGLYNIVMTYGFAGMAAQKIFWGLLATALAFLSVYMITSSIISAYIATLPDMTPMAALKSAHRLVRYRRLAILRKLLFLFIVLTITSCVLIIPVLLLAPLAAPWLAFLLGVVSLPIIHAYVYELYRELLV